MTNALVELFNNHRPIQGDNTLWLEFGVWKGSTINYISAHRDGLVYGFDSFKGLPEDWRDGFLKEFFNNNGELPKTNSNVKLIVGLFNETLEQFLLEHNGKKITFLHIDCDLYSSSKYVLDKCTPFLCEGSFVVFDELLDYDGYENGEWKAMNEWVAENDIRYEWVGSKPEEVQRECFSLKILSIKN